jgi:general secretion pathway protein J
MRGTNNGFTLVEVLVALAIFGVLSLLAYMTLGSTLANSDLISERMDRMQSIQRSVRMLSSDFAQSAPRPVRDELGTGYRAAILAGTTGDFALEITRGGWSNPAGLPRSTLQRTAYRIEENSLVRYHWNVLDRTFGNEPVATVLLDNVDALGVRFLEANGEWSDVWPPQGVQGQAALKGRPRAVEFVLSLPDEGEISRLLEVAP